MEIINKFVFNNFEIKERFESGIMLTGPEVKSVKSGKVNFKGSYCGFGESLLRASAKRHNLFIKNFYIAPYKPAEREQRKYDPVRPRKLLLHNLELNFLIGKSKQSGFTIIPLRIYTKNRLVKLEIAVAYGLKEYDKREKVKKKEFERRKARLVSR